MESQENFQGFISGFFFFFACIVHMNHFPFALSDLLLVKINFLSKGSGNSFLNKKIHSRGPPGGSVVKNPPANAGDWRSIHDAGRPHVPWDS